MTRVILGLAGEIAAGKGTVAKHIVEKHNGSSHRFSTVLRDILERIYLDKNRENMQKASTMLRETYFSDILSMIISKDVEKDEHEVIAIDGVRRMADIAYLQKLSGFKLIYVDASMENRYERIIQRGENVDDKTKTFEEFKKDHEREAELQIRDLREKADFVVDNNSSLEDLYRQIDNIIERCKN